MTNERDPQLEGNFSEPDIAEEIRLKIAALFTDPSTPWEGGNSSREDDTTYDCYVYEAQLAEGVIIGVLSEQENMGNPEFAEESSRLYLAVDRPGFTNGQTFVHYSIDIEPESGAVEEIYVHDRSFLFENLEALGRESELTQAVIYDQVNTILGMVTTQDGDAVIQYLASKVPNYDYVAGNANLSLGLDYAGLRHQSEVDEQRDALEGIDMSNVDSIVFYEGRSGGRQEEPFITLYKSEGALTRFGAIFNPSLRDVIGGAAYDILPSVIDFGEFNGEITGPTDAVVTLDGAYGVDKKLIANRSITPDDQHGKKYFETLTAATELFNAVSSADSEYALAAGVGEWIARYCNSPEKGKNKLQKLTEEQSFNYLNNAAEIINEAETEMLTANFEEIVEHNAYRYALPTNKGKQVIVHSSNFYANDVTWGSEEYDATISIEIEDAANQRANMVVLKQAGSEHFMSEDSLIHMGDTLCDALEAILDQDKVFPALGHEIRTKLEEVDDKLFANLATGEVTSDDLAASINAIRYFLGHSGINAERTRIRQVNKADAAIVTIVDNSIMAKDGKGGSIGIGRTTLLTRNDTTTQLPKTTLIATNIATGAHEVLNVASDEIHGRIAESATVTGLVVLNTQSIKDLIIDDGGERTLSTATIFDEAQAIHDYKTIAGLIPRHRSNGPVVYKTSEEQ